MMVTVGKSFLLLFHKRKYVSNFLDVSVFLQIVFSYNFMGILKWEVILKVL